MLFLYYKVTRQGDDFAKTAIKCKNNPIFEFLISFMLINFVYLTKLIKTESIFLKKKKQTFRFRSIISATFQSHDVVKHVTSSGVVIGQKISYVKLKCVSCRKCKQWIHWPNIIMSFVYDSFNETNWSQNCGLLGNVSGRCDTCNDWYVKLWQILQQGWFCFMVEQYWQSNEKTTTKNPKPSIREGAWFSGNHML